MHYSTSTSLSTVPRVDSVQSFDSGKSDINISGPIMPPTPPPQEPPSLAGYAQTPTSSQLPPASSQSHPAVQEDYYDVPVPAPYVSVSPSQVSLVSNGSHYSSESTTSSTRSASPQLTRSTLPHQAYQPPPTNGMQQPHPQMTPYTSQPSGHIYQSPVHQNDLPFVNRSDMTPSAMKYIPATLPRPRKDTNPRPVPPKPHKAVAQNQYQQPGYLQTQNQQPGNHQTQFYSPQHYQKPSGRLVKQSSLPEHDKDSDDDENLSSFALALKQKKLRKTVHVSDRSVPKV